MIRNLKACGLALVAAMALGAIGTQNASAVVEHSFHSDIDETVLTGLNEGNVVWTVNEESIALECSIATVEGTVEGGDRDTITLHPEFSSCLALGKDWPITTAGCNYVLDSDTTTSLHSSSAEHAAVSIECEPEQHITFSLPGCLFRYDDEHEGKQVNQSLHGARFVTVSDSSKESLTLTLTVSTMHYTVPTSCFLIGIPKGTYTGSSITAKFVVTAYEDSTVVSGSTTTGRTWSHGAQVNIGITTP